ncbi:glycosyltransferase family 2 protein, partial [Vibrio alginolyticus]|nr:glycosyltransferase family 2 protein [Vibrio alginolyticus]
MNEVFTVFTPTYNRDKLLHRVYDSLTRQTFRSFEWLVIDDGSTDNTEDLINEMTKKSDFKIRYVKQKNSGKVNSINTALTLARGEFFLVFDSDDWCHSDALYEYYSAWESLSLDEKKEYCAISCLKEYTSGVIVGEDYSRMRMKGETYIDRYNRRIRGDKWECIRTEIHRKYPYDIFNGEKYMAPEYAWINMGRKYKTLFINKSLSIIEYQDDGISKNNIVHRANSPISTIKFYSLAKDLSENIVCRL